jgi:FtsZ-binding cell division protein ZapB
MAQELRAENESLTHEFNALTRMTQGLRAENDDLQREIEKLQYTFSQQEVRMFGGMHHENNPERQGRILPFDDKSHSETSIQPVRGGGGGGKKTSL